jgi:hypothetical protein
MYKWEIILFSEKKDIALNQIKVVLFRENTDLMMSCDCGSGTDLALATHVLGTCDYVLYWTAPCTSL